MLKRNIFLGIGFFLAIFLVGVTILFSYLPFPQTGDKPLPYFQRLTFANLYGFFNRQDILRGGQTALAGLDVQPIYSKLDGTIISAPEEVMIGLMVDNQPDARPQQSGLSKASIVYEALAEGDITRFLAIFSYQDIDHLGPVRSARPYFARFAAEYQGGYGHAGGSPDALALIPSLGVVNLEGLYYEEIDGKTWFYRDKRYHAPHNLFAVPADLKKLVLEKKEKPFLAESRFHFGNLEHPEILPDATKITIDFSDEYFKAEYQYDAETNSYKRLLAGKPHIDHLTETQIAPRNVLVEFTSYYPYDEKGRLKMRVEGEGKALIFTQGKMITATWKKEGSELTRFYDGEGKDVVLNSGQTWIEVVEGEERVEVEEIEGEGVR